MKKRKGVNYILSLLASVLGIGGLANKVLGLVRKVRKRVQKALTKLWLKIKKAGKKIWRKLGFGKKKEKEGSATKTKEEEVIDIDEKTPFVVANEDHDLWIDDDNLDNPILMMASTPEPMEKKLKTWENDVKDKSKGAKRTVGAAIKRIRANDKRIDKQVKRLDKAKKKSPIKTKITDLKNDVIKDVNKILSVLDKKGMGVVPVVGVYPQKPEIKAYNKKMNEEFGMESAFAESHHVPENALMENIKGFYNQISNTLGTNSSFSDLKEEVDTRHNMIVDTYKSGNNLPAIVLNVLTHRLAKSAVHSSVNGAAVVSQLKSDLEKEDNQPDESNPQIVLRTKSGTLIAKAQTKHWQNFIQEFYKLEKLKEKQNGEATGVYSDYIQSKKEEDSFIINITADTDSANAEIAAETKKEIEDKMKEFEDRGREANVDKVEFVSNTKKRIENTTENAFESSLNANLASVTVALSDSKLDGDSAEHSGILTKMKKESKKLWSKNAKRIVGKF
ncbi:hypothetical protein ABW636_00350 [Aquimarina sp. 2201CG1-2-11]|uniref:hypothetical protein n=1 Tax=Aquimarina discodermiae TaxID=3231043 RepID=UPI003462BDCF